VTTRGLERGAVDDAHILRGFTAAMAALPERRGRSVTAILVVSVSLRRWRNHLLSTRAMREMSTFRDDLRRDRCSAVLDLQEQVKAAPIAPLARGVRHGPDRAGIREPIVTLAHEVHHTIDKLWPEANWRAPIGALVRAGFVVLLPCGPSDEHARSQLAAGETLARVPPWQPLGGVGQVPSADAVLDGASALLRPAPNC